MRLSTGNVRRTYKDATGGNQKIDYLYKDILLLLFTITKCCQEI